MGRLSAWTERWNRLIYDISRPILAGLQAGMVGIGVLSMAVLFWYVGFPLSPTVQQALEWVMDICLALFALDSLVRWQLQLKRWDYLKRHPWQLAGALLVMLELLVDYLAGSSLLHQLTGSDVTGEMRFHLIKQIVLAVYSCYWVITGMQFIFQFSFRPALLFLLSFLLVAVVGAILLALPEMTTDGHGMPLLDALFTATSATCVTGLAVADTGTYFTLKGQVVLLLLMQIGGIGILTFATFFALILHQGFGIQHQLYLKDVTSVDNVKSSIELLRPIILFTLAIELAGALLIFVQTMNSTVAPFAEQHWTAAAFYAVFHSVSAFCNAGFSLYPNSFMHESVVHQPLLLVTFATLIILGGIGFPVLREWLDPAARRERKQKPWKGYSISSRIALYTTLALVMLGWLAILALETPHTLAGMPWWQKLSTSFFESVTTRTAGFNSLDTGALSMPTVMLFLLFMLIGGSSGGTAGGIKTSTFVLLVRGVVSTVRGQRQITLWHRAISKTLLYRAFTIFSSAILFLFISSFLLILFHPDIDPIDLIFEAVSSFATVGLSRGITADLSPVGQVIIIISMFAGRIGILSLAFALSSPAASSSVNYPEGYVMVG